MCGMLTACQSPFTLLFSHVSKGAGLWDLLQSYVLSTASNAKWHRRPYDVNKIQDFLSPAGSIKDTFFLPTKTEKWLGLFGCLAQN